MSSKAFTIKTRKFMTNRLLQRKQFVLEVFHPGRANVSKAELKEALAKLPKFKGVDPKCIVLFGFRTKFGGGKSAGFGLVYDNIKAEKLVEPKFRLVRNGLDTAEQKSRKQIKEKKNRQKWIRGTAKTKVATKKKK